MFIQIILIKRNHFFESLEGDKNWSRYTIIGCSSGDFIEIYGDKIHKFSDFTCEEVIQDPNPIRWLEKHFKNLMLLSQIAFPRSQEVLLDTSHLNPFAILRIALKEKIKKMISMRQIYL